MQRYQRIFPCFSPEDADLVVGVAAVAEALGDRYLADVIDTRRSGAPDEWLLPKIAEADVFQLFWSSHSMSSPSCRRQWETALTVPKDEFIRPLYWEDPFPRVEESTRFAQPAIFCASIAAYDALDLRPGVAAGHSLGELAALAAAGVLDRDDALELVVLRGKLMAEADDTGSMLALVGATEEEAAEIAAHAGVTVATYASGWSRTSA